MKGCRKTRPPSGQRGERNGHPFPHELNNGSLSRIKSTWCGCNRQRSFRRGLLKDGVLKWGFMAYGCKKSRSAIEGMWWDYQMKKRNVALDRGAVGGW